MHRRLVSFVLTFCLMITAPALSMATSDSICTGDAVVVTEPDRSDGELHVDVVLTNGCSTDYRYQWYVLSWPLCDEDNRCPGFLNQDDSEEHRKDYRAFLEELSVGHVLHASMRCTSGQGVDGPQTGCGGLRASILSPPLSNSGSSMHERPTFSNLDEHRVVDLDEVQRLSTSEVRELREKHRHRVQAGDFGIQPRSPQEEAARDERILSPTGVSLQSLSGDEITDEEEFFEPTRDGNLGPVRGIAIHRMRSKVKGINECLERRVPYEELDLFWVVTETRVANDNRALNTRTLESTHPAAKHCVLSELKRLNRHQSISNRFESDEPYLIVIEWGSEPQ